MSRAPIRATIMTGASRGVGAAIADVEGEWIARLLAVNVGGK